MKAMMLLAVSQSGGGFKSVGICVAVGTVLVLVALMVYGSWRAKKISTVHELGNQIKSAVAAGRGGEWYMRGVREFAAEAQRRLKVGDYSGAAQQAQHGLGLLTDTNAA